MLASFVLVGTKGVSENNVARRFSTGTLSTMKSHSSAPTKLNSLSKTGNIPYLLKKNRAKYASVTALQSVF